MATYQGLPIYQMVINEDDTFTGIEFISLVDAPAIEKNFMTFKASTYKMFDAQPDKQIITGPAILANTPIYRCDEALGEYFVTFSPEEIVKMVTKFNAQAKTNIGVNLMHQPNSMVKGAVIFEQWIVTNPEDDKSKALGFTNIPAGSYFVSCHISDTTFWDEQIKTGIVKGWSIEGFLDLEMKKIKKIINMADIKTTDGKTLSTVADEFIVGSAVTLDGKPAPDADYVVENGVTLTVVNGLITKVVEVETTPQPEGAPAPPALVEVTHPLGEKMAVTPDDIKAIDDSLKITATFADFEARIAKCEAMMTTMAAENVVLTTANVEMKAKFAAIPGAELITTNEDDDSLKNILGIKTKMTFAEKVNAVKALNKTKK